MSSNPLQEIDLNDFAKNSKPLGNTTSTPSPSTSTSTIDLNDFASVAKPLSASSSSVKFGTEQFSPDILKNLVKQYGLTITSATRSSASNAKAGGAKKSYHLSGQAYDIGGDEKQRRRLAEHIRDTYGSNVAELFYQDISVKNGKQGKVRSDHNDHVHVAWKPLYGQSEGNKGKGRTYSTFGVGKEVNTLQSPSTLTTPMQNQGFQKKPAIVEPTNILQQFSNVNPETNILAQSVDPNAHLYARPAKKLQATRGIGNVLASMTNPALGLLPDKVVNRVIGGGVDTTLQAVEGGLNNWSNPLLVGTPIVTPNGVITNSKDRNLPKKVADVRGFFKEVFPRGEADGFTDRTLDMVGNIAPYLAVGAVGGKPAVTLFGIAQQSQALADEAKAMGANETQVELARMGGAVIGSTSALGSEATTTWLTKQGLKKEAAKAIINSFSKRALQGGLNVGADIAINVGQQVANNVVARDIAGFDKKRGRLQGTGEAALVGGVMSGLSEGSKLLVKPKGSLSSTIAATETNRTNVELKQSHDDLLRKLNTMDKPSYTAYQEALWADPQMRAEIERFTESPQGDKAAYEARNRAEVEFANRYFARNIDKKLTSTTAKEIDNIITNNPEVQRAIQEGKVTDVQITKNNKETPTASFDNKNVKNPDDGVLTFNENALKDRAKEGRADEIINEGIQHEVGEYSHAWIDKNKSGDEFKGLASEWVNKNVKDEQLKREVLNNIEEGKGFGETSRDNVKGNKLYEVEEKFVSNHTWSSDKLAQGYREGIGLGSKLDSPNKKLLIVDEFDDGNWLVQDVLGREEIVPKDGFDVNEFFTPAQKKQGEDFNKGKQATMTPEGSGSSVLSNEELNRQEVYYKVGKSGELTYQGKQPDAYGLKNEESVLAVNKNTGEVRVESGSYDALGKYGEKVKEASGYARTIRENQGKLSQEGGFPKGSQKQGSSNLYQKGKSRGEQEATRKDVTSQTPEGIKNETSKNEEVVPVEDYGDFAERSLPNSLDRVGLEGGNDREYQIAHNDTSRMKAGEIVSSKTADEFLEEIRNSQLLTPEQQIAAMRYNARLKLEALEKEKAGDFESADRLVQTANEIASVTSAKATEAGQSIQAIHAGLIETSEGAVQHAERLLAARKKGDTLSPTQAAEVFSTANRRIETEAKVDKLDVEYADVLDRVETQKMEARQEGEDAALISKLEKRIAELEARSLRKTKRATTSEELRKEFGDLQQEFNQWARKSLGKTSMSFDSEGAKIVSKMAYNLVKQGYVKISDIVDSVYTQILDINPSYKVDKREIRDIISGYEKANDAKPTRTLTDEQLKANDIKKQGRTLSKIEDLEAGKTLQTTKREVKESPELQVLKKKLQETRNLTKDNWQNSLRKQAENNPTDIIAQGAYKSAKIGTFDKQLNKTYTEADWVKEMTDEFGDEFTSNKKAIYMNSFDAKKAAKDSASEASKQKTLQRELTKEGIDVQDAVKVQEYLDKKAKLQEEAKQARADEAALYESLAGGSWQRRLGSALGLTRALKTTFDLSASGRQGAIFLTHPKAFAKSFTQQLQAMSKWTPEEFHKYEQEVLYNDPDFKEAQKYDVGFTLASSERGAHSLAQAEEAFQTNLVQVLENASWDNRGKTGKTLLSPVKAATMGVRLSEQAYVTMLNTLRLQMYKQFKKELTTPSKLLGFMNKASSALGEDITKKIDTPQKLDAELAGIAKFIRNATGRGDLGKLQGIQPVVNGLMFSPRWVASRFNLIANPMFYMRLPKRARVIAAREMIKFTGLVTTTMAVTAAGLSAAGVDAEVGLDPDSADFLKLRVGNSHYDLSGGFQQEIRLVARFLQMAENKREGKFLDKSNAPKGMQDKELTTILRDFARSKASPIAGEAYDAWVGERMEYVTDPKTGKVGKKPYSIKDTPSALFAPLVGNDFIEAYKKEGIKGSLMMTPTFFGVSTQNYKPFVNPNTQVKENYRKQLQSK